MSTTRNPETKNLDYYCKLFSENLNVNKTEESGETLYQPLLLLAVTDLIAQGVIKENRITITENLRETFNMYKKSFGYGDRKSSISLPFFHLKNTKNKEDRFWFLDFNEKYENTKIMNDRIRKSIYQTNIYINYAYFDAPLFELLQDQKSRQELTDTIIHYWFSDYRKNLTDVLRVNQDLQNKLDRLVQNETPTARRKSYICNSPVRLALFGQSVVELYDYKCAVCGLKVFKNNNPRPRSIVDAAHIMPLAKFYDNNPDNGISLCKNHHWAFDYGLFSLSIQKNKEYKIVVSKEFEEESPNGRPLKEFNGCNLLMPISQEYYPRHAAIEWHYKNVFKAS